MTNEPYWCPTSQPNTQDRGLQNTLNQLHIVQNTWVQVYSVLEAVNDDYFSYVPNIGDSRDNPNVIPFNTKERPISHRFHQWTFLTDATQIDIEHMYELYSSLAFLGQLRSRSQEYITANIDNFLTVQLDGQIVGCVEIINVDENTIELGGIAVDRDIQNMNIGLQLIDAVERYAYMRGLTIISVTGSPKLARIYEKRWYVLRESGEYDKRAKQSPTKHLYIKPYRDTIVAFEYPEYPNFGAIRT